MTSKELRIDWWPIDRLKPYPGNPRRIPASAVEKVAGSIAEFGWRQPIVVDDHDVILAGHTRRLAALKIGAGQVPVHVARGLSAEQARAFRLADNRSHEESDWDLSSLSLELESLREAGINLEITGFSLVELSKLLGYAGGPVDPEAVPPVPENPVSQPGDVWLLGDHRLMCGDSTKGESVAKLQNGEMPHLMVTDPPYGVAYDPVWRNEAGASATRRTGKVLNDHRADWREAWALFSGNVANVWHGALHAATVAESLVACGFAIRSQIVWAKDRLVLSRGDYHWQHEPCWYAVREKATGHWSGDRTQTTLWEIASRDQDAATEHSTQKPVECMRRPMENNSKPGDAVYEPFCGSGTSVIAAEQAGRRCFGMELNPAYVDMAILRWQSFVGKVATHATTGEKFPEIASQMKRQHDAT